ncbi:MAG: hypothetical protein HY929_01960 [Euryarchaeota archaeon]|nr:hypothetical protein [Euryarchaeota archaeon]
MQRITISLPKDLADVLGKIVKEEPKFGKKSHLFVEALKEYIEFHHPEHFIQGKPKGPLVLKSLKIRQKLRGPSLVLKGRPKLEGFRIEE